MGCRNDLIDHLPDENVYTGGKGNVDPKIRGQRYQYEEVPTPNTKIQTGIDRSEHLPPPPYRSHDPMTSGRLSSPAPKRLPPNPQEHSYERPQSTGVADRALHDEHPAGIRRGLTTYLPGRDNPCGLAPDVRPRSQVNQPQTHLNIVANEGSRDPVFNSDSRLGYHPPAPDNLRRPQLGVICDRRDVVQATGDRQYPTQSLQGQYRGHQPHKVRQYPDQDDVNNHHIPSHDPDRVDDANGDHNHHHGRGRQRQRNPPYTTLGVIKEAIIKILIRTYNMVVVTRETKIHNYTTLGIVKEAIIATLIRTYNMVVVTRETKSHNYTTLGIVKEAIIGTLIRTCNIAPVVTVCLPRKMKVLLIS